MLSSENLWPTKLLYIIFFVECSKIFFNNFLMHLNVHWVDKIICTLVRGSYYFVNTLYFEIYFKNKDIIHNRDLEKAIHYFFRLFQ